MSNFTDEQAQVLFQKYEELKKLIIDIDHKYSLNYQEPQLDLPPSLDLPKLTFVAKTQSELTELATQQQLPNHTRRLYSCEQAYQKALLALQAKQNHLAEKLRVKLTSLLDSYNVNLKNLRNRLVNNGLIFSSVVTKANADALTEYNAKVSQANVHFQNEQDAVTQQIAQTQANHQQKIEALQDELEQRVASTLADLVYAQQKEEERITKYNISIDEKETKYKASIERTKQYARQAEQERALNASRLYAELGESGVASQKSFEKYTCAQQFFQGWKKDEILLVVNTDGFLQGHLGNYYSSLISWVNAQAS